MTSNSSKFRCAARIWEDAWVSPPPLFENPVKQGGGETKGTPLMRYNGQWQSLQFTPIVCSDWLAASHTPAHNYMYIWSRSFQEQNS